MKSLFNSLWRPTFLLQSKSIGCTIRVDFELVNRCFGATLNVIHVVVKVVSKYITKMSLISIHLCNTFIVLTLHMKILNETLKIWELDMLLIINQSKRYKQHSQLNRFINKSQDWHNERYVRVSSTVIIIL